MKYWFTAKLRIACLVDAIAADDGENAYMEPLHIFKAENFEEAFQIALQLGREHEEEFVNANQNRAKWKFKEVLTLDIIRNETLDGAEIYCDFSDFPKGEKILFTDEFEPEKSKPGQTI